jgi:hypothetical protein
LFEQQFKADTPYLPKKLESILQTSRLPGLKCYNAGHKTLEGSPHDRKSVFSTQLSPSGRYFGSRRFGAFHTTGQQKIPDEQGQQVKAALREA